MNMVDTVVESFPQANIDEEPPAKVESPQINPPRGSMRTYGSKGPFEGQDSSSYFRIRALQIDEAVKTYDPNKLLNTPTSDLVSYFQKAFELRPPEIDGRDRWTMEQREVYVTGANDYGFRSSHKVPATELTVSVGFQGERELLLLAPASRSLPTFEVNLGRSEITVTVTERTPDLAQITRKIDALETMLKSNLQSLKNEIYAFNDQIANRVGPLIEQRKKRLLRDKDLVAQIGIPLKKRADAPKTYAAPEVRRKIAPPPNPPAASTAPYVPEPALEESEYAHILQVIGDMALMMERSPSAFKNMGEEDIRSHFLVQLNGHYEGTATGETFNFDGKTDILVRSRGKNIFIGECKFWSGEQAYLDTINQILGYLSWRDTKAAVIIFNRNKDFSAVLDKIKAATLKHDNVKSGPIVETESRFRYVFRSQQDDNKELILTVLAFDVPT